MAERFTEPEDGLEPRPEIEQREGEDDDIFALVDMAISEIRKATDSLASGGLSVEAWYDQMADILYAYHLAGWYVGQGTDDDPTDEQMDRIAAVVAEQLDYLDNFRNDLLKEDDDTLAPAYRNRAEMYGRATVVSLWMGKAGQFRLPAYPRDGSTDCVVGCNCTWIFGDIDLEVGNMDVTWRLGASDHCTQCQARAKAWKPFKIRGWEWEPNQVTAKLFK